MSSIALKEIKNSDILKRNGYEDFTIEGSKLTLFDIVNSNDLSKTHKLTFDLLTKKYKYSYWKARNLLSYIENIDDEWVYNWK